MHEEFTNLERTMPSLEAATIEKFGEVTDVDSHEVSESGELFDVDDTAQTDEEQFASEIEAMSLDELQAERDRLVALSKMSDVDIFEEYDKSEPKDLPGKGYEALLEGLTKEELSTLRDGLEARDPAALEYFGIKDGDDDGPELVLKRMR